jgi:hypothetical protein
MYISSSSCPGKPRKLKKKGLNYLYKKTCWEYKFHTLSKVNVLGFGKKP